MLKKLPKQPQLEMFKTVLTSFIHPEHELYFLANKIDWAYLENEFAPLYGTVGRPSVPIRKIVGLLLLKQMYNLGDETVVQRYLENPYWSRVLGTERLIFSIGYHFTPVTSYILVTGLDPKGWRRSLNRASICLVRM